MLIAVSTFQDAGLLDGCIASAEGRPVLALDGAYETYQRREPWLTDAAEVSQLRERYPNLDYRQPRLHGHPPWRDEAHKRTALLRHAVNRARRTNERWILVLDADERLEGADALDAVLASTSAAWGTIRIYLGTQPGRAGYWIPRLLPAQGRYEYRPPTDWCLFRDGERVAFLDGDGPAPDTSVLQVPLEVARIRHDRHLRPSLRLQQSGSYIRRRTGNALQGDGRW